MNEEMNELKEQISTKRSQLQSSMDLLTQKIEKLDEVTKDIKRRYDEKAEEVRKQLEEQKANSEEFSKQLEENANELNKLSGFAINKKKQLFASIETLRYKISQANDKVKELELKEKNVQSEGESKISEYEHDISMLTETVRKYTREFTELNDKLKAM